MKDLKSIILLMVILIASSTVYSQTIEGLSRREKVDIVSTLQDYPLVLEELELTTELLKVSNLRIAELTAVNANQSKQIELYEQRDKVKDKKIQALERQVEINQITIGDKLKYGSYGAVFGLVVALLISVL